MRSGVLMLVLVAALPGMVSTALAQPRRAFLPSGMGVTSEIDRGVSQAMIEAQQAIKQKQYAAAVLVLQSILDHPEDYFLYRDFNDKHAPAPAIKDQVQSNLGEPPPGKKAPGEAELSNGARARLFNLLTAGGGVRRQTQRIIAELPAEGKAAYELEFGATARARLSEALAADDFDKLAEVIRRFQMTTAGLDALQQLAASYFDHDQLIESALLYEAMFEHPAANQELNASLLLRAAYVWHLAGQDDRGAALLDSLRELNEPAFWRIGNQKLPPFQQGADAAMWLATQFGSPVKQRVRIVKEWQMPRGGVSGNESAATAYPVGGTAWANSTLKYSRFSFDDQANQAQIAEFDQLIQQVERSLKDNNRLTQPTTMPLVVNNVVIYRTLNDVTAVDLATGQLKWRSSQVDGMFSWLFQVPTNEMERFSITTPTSIPGYVRHKLFRDQLTGSISSDGQNVYVIEGAETQFNPMRPRGRQRFGGPFVLSPTNKLVAYDIQSGEIAWEVGGLSGTPPVELSGVFFLGPPLPYDGRLYCLAEVKDELCLVVLAPEAATARLDYSQTLIALDPVNWLGWPRRLSGLMPVLSNQIMICPTASGSIVAYDLLFRQLRWGYSYDIQRGHNDDDERQMGLAIQDVASRVGRNPLGDDEDGRWIDGGPLISGGSVIFTPRDSNELHCVNLVTGTPVWKRPRGSGLYVGCIENETVYVIGRNQILAVSLTDGSEVWPQPIEITEPSGRGVRVGSKYLVPLSSGEIVTLDLTKGRIQGRSRLAESQVPGNLAIGDDTLVSCSAHEVAAFPSMPRIEQEIREQIVGASNAEALALRGELRLHQGEETEAIDDLRESLAKRPDSRVKRILAGTLLSTAQKDPAQLLKFADELLQLTEDPRQKIEFLRLYAESLNVAGNQAGAVTQLFRLADISSSLEELTTAGPRHAISLERNIRSQLLNIYQAANSEQQTRIEQEFQRQLELKLAGADRDQKVAEFVKLVSGHPAAESLLLSLLDSKEAPLTDVERFRLLERLSFSNQPTIAGPAVARLAEQALGRNSAGDAKPWIDQLARQFATQICLDKQTGQQLYDKWHTRDDVRAFTTPETVWPAGPTDVERSTGIMLPIWLQAEIVSRHGNHFAGWNFEIDPANAILQARDPFLKVAWQMPYASFQEVSRAQPCQLHIRGHRLAFSFGGWLVVMETQDSYEAPTVVFEKSTRTNSPVEWRQNEFRIERRLLPSGRRVPYDGRSGFLAGLSDDALFFQQENKLSAFDIETGQLAWSRTESQYVKSDVDVDDVLALHTDTNDGILLRPLDGKLLDHTKGNRNERIIWYGGTRKLSQRIEGNDVLLFEMRDVVGDQSIWKSRHPTGCSTSIIGGQEFAVLELTGKLTIIDLESGNAKLTSQLAVARPLGSSPVLAVQKYGERYIVIAGVSTKRTELITVNSLNETSFTVDGSVFAVNRQTGQVDWSVPCEQQAYDYSQPVNLPILVLASQHMKSDRIIRQDMIRLSALIIDKQSGRTVYATQESQKQPCPGARFIPRIAENKLIVDFSNWNLTLTFDKPGN